MRAEHARIVLDLGVDLDALRLAEQGELEAHAEAAEALAAVVARGVAEREDAGERVWWNPRSVVGDAELHDRSRLVADRRDADVPGAGLVGVVDQLARRGAEVEAGVARALQRLLRLGERRVRELVRLSGLPVVGHVFSPR